MSDRGQAPPNDIPAEQAVLGAMMLSADTIGDITPLLDAADFYRPVHGTLFTTIVGMFGDGDPVDPITVATHLDKAGDLERVGGINYLHTIIEYARPASATYYANAVADAATERRGLEHGTKTIAIIGQDGSTADKVAAIRQSADTIGGPRERNPGAWVADLISPALTAIDTAGRGEDGLIIPTGFSDLDRLLGGGLRGGQLVVIGARPGIGKSTLLLDIGRNAAVRGSHTTAMISLEMTKEAIMQRFLAAESRVPLAFIRTGNLRDDEMGKVIDRVQPIADAPFRVIDQPMMSLAEIRAEARRLKHRYNLKLMLIDYLQLMTTPPGYESRQQFVADMSRGLKILALELDITVIMASQLNRGPEQRQDRKPSLGDLRESGAIEQDVDVAILLHRPDADDREHARAGEVDFIVAKHRNGETGTVTVANQLHLARFVDMSIV